MEQTNLLIESELKLFKQVLEFLYGPGYRNQASIVFQVNIRTIDNWYNDRTPIPSHVWVILEKMVNSRIMELAECLPKIQTHMNRALRTSSSSNSTAPGSGLTGN